ncbi:MAG TPA: DUF6527 family protein [Tepidisphaeraceae bacterium]|jgi:hypothetical protein|nr:DUF6527 family protein [Tepidisphaeraceae bacterium]
MNVKLTDPWFDAAFFYGAQPDGSCRLHHPDGTPTLFSEAQGLFLWCPCGYGALDKDGALKFPLDLSLNHGRPHGVMVCFANPPCGIALPPDFGPTSKGDKSRHPRWNVGGTGLADLTLSPSVDVGDPSCWHGHIHQGEIT